MTEIDKEKLGFGINIFNFSFFFFFEEIGNCEYV